MDSERASRLARTATLALCAAAAHPLLGAEVETQHALDITLPLKPRLELILHSRIRTQPGGLGFYQVRTGPIFSWEVASRVSLLGGYYFAKQERRIDNDFIGGHRPFGGAEFAVVEARRFAFDQRFLAERFLSDATDDFNRYRSRSRLSLKGPLAPYASLEAFFDAKGWRSNRHAAGIRWSASRFLQIDLGYFYEHRRAGIGPDRHMWITSVHLKKSSRRADPDL